MVNFQQKCLTLCCLTTFFVLPAIAGDGGEIDQNNSPDQVLSKTIQASYPVFPPQSEAFKSARQLLLNGHYHQYVKQLQKTGANGDKQCLDELAYLYNNGRIVSEDKKQAITIRQGLAAKCYGPGMCHLAAMYLEGDCGPKDYVKARNLFARASALGCEFGPVGTAYMYSQGLGCKTDYAKALSLCNQLCAKNSPLGWCAKAELLWQGHGTKKDIPQAMKLFQLAAEVGYTRAQYWLAYNYYYGQKIPIDYVKARYWAQRGSDQGDTSCQLLMATIKTSKSDEEKDCAGATKLLEALAEQQILEAQNRLGHAYHEGDCVKKNIQTSIFWLEKAAARNYVPSINELACMYFGGDGVPKDQVKALQLNLKGATQQKARAADRAACQYNVGMAYGNGLGTKQDLVKARDWYTKAAAAGNPHACNNLSLIYLQGLGCAVDKNKAMTLRRLGVKNGCYMACTNLGQDYRKGRNGVNKNIPEAIRLLKKSLELRSDNADANYELAKIYETGLAGKADKKLAEQYYKESAKYGNEAAIKWLRGEKVSTFGSTVNLPMHRSSFVSYDIDQRAAKFFVHRPKDYNSNQKYGLVVYIDTSNESASIPAGWEEVLDRHHLLFISPQDAGNKIDPDKRAGLAVVAAMQMLNKYNINKNQVYAAGALGGARVVSILGFNQNDIFRGTIQSCGSDFYRKVQKHYQLSKEAKDDDYGLCESSPAEIASARSTVKFALITGKDDFRRGNVLNIYHEGFVEDGFQAKLFDVETIGRNDCDGKTLEQVLDFLQETSN